MDLTLTPTLKLAGTSNELLDRNFRRIDDAFAAKAIAAPLPKNPIDPITSYPTIGLAATNNGDLNHNFRLIDLLFSATPPTLSTSRLRYTGNEVLNSNFRKVVFAFIAAAVAIPPPELIQEAVEPVLELHVEHAEHPHAKTRKHWYSQSQTEDS